MFNRDTHLIFETYYTRTYLVQEVRTRDGQRRRDQIHGLAYLPGEYKFEGDRAGVILQIGGHGKLAFYKSSAGTGGKKKKDHWYPFFGHGGKNRNKDNNTTGSWVIKGGSYHATDGYDFPQVRAAMDKLDNGPWGKHMSFNDEDEENFEIEGIHDGGTNSFEDVWPAGSPQADFFETLQPHLGVASDLQGPDAFKKLGEMAYGEYDIALSDGGSAVYDHIDNIFQNIGLIHEVPGYQRAGEANRRREQPHADTMAADAARRSGISYADGFQTEPGGPPMFKQPDGSIRYSNGELVPGQPQPEQPEGEQPEDEQLKFEFPEDEQPEQPDPEPTQPEQPEPEPTQPEQPEPEPTQPEQPEPEPEQPGQQPQRGVNRRLALLRRQQQQQQQQQMGGMGQQQQQQQQQQLH